MIKLGKGARVKLDTTDIAEVTSFSPSLSMETVDAKAYGDDYAKPIVTGRAFTCSIEGHLDPDDASQSTFLTEALSATDTVDPKNTCKVDTLKFYEDSTNYWAPDTATDADAHFVMTSFSWTPDLSGLIAFSAEIQAYGPVYRTS